MYCALPTHAKIININNNKKPMLLLYQVSLLIGLIYQLNLDYM